MVSEDDLKQINQTSVPLADGTGYIVGIEAFHELHCLVGNPSCEEAILLLIPPRTTFDVEFKAGQFH